MMDSTYAPSDPEAHAGWLAAYEQTNLRDIPFETMSGVPVDAVYGDAPYPGQYPFTRGVHASMYRSRLWTMRMFAGLSTAFRVRHGGGHQRQVQGPAARRRHRTVNSVRHARR